MSKYLVALAMSVNLLAAGCVEQTGEPRRIDIIEEINATGTMTAAQVKSLSVGNRKSSILKLDGLTSITDEQAQSLNRVKAQLSLKGLTSITDAQAESLSKVKYLHVSESIQSEIDAYRSSSSNP